MGVMYYIVEINTGVPQFWGYLQFCGVGAVYFTVYQHISHIWLEGSQVGSPEYLHIWKKSRKISYLDASWEPRIATLYMQIIELSAIIAKA